MQPPQNKDDHKKLDNILQAYSMFGSSQSYHQKCALFKKKILNDDHFTIKIVVNAMRNILTYRQMTNWRHIFKIQDINQENILFQAYNSLTLNEFSKLLVLRFLRQTYFESNYVFMNYVHIQLSDIMLKIGLFKKQSRDDERGRYMFYPQSKLFENVNQQGAIKKIDKQVETIGFSIHKLALQILFTCGQLTHCLPFHQEFVNKEQSKLNENFKNGLYVVYQRLAKQQIKFPSKFHYFKEKDVSKFSNDYLKINVRQKISKIFISIFQQVWTMIDSAIKDDLKQNEPNIYLITNGQVLSSDLQDKIDFCSKLVLHTCDRYFWKHFAEYLDKILSQLKNKLQQDESLIEKQQKSILGIHLFILFFNQRLLQPQIMYLIDSKYVQQLACIFLKVLRLSEKIISWIIFCFRRIKQLSLQFKHQLYQKMRKEHCYPFISLYADIILQLQPSIQSNMIEINGQTLQLQRSIIEKMKNKYQHYVKKQQFIKEYYKRQTQIDTKNTKQNYNKSLQAIINQKGVILRDQSLSVEYINIEKQSIAQQEIQIVPKKQTVNSIKIRNSYRINLIGSQRNYKSLDKNISQIDTPTFRNIKPPSSALSFVQSLKVSVSKPNETLVKSLSSSRKVKRMNNTSGSNMKSFSSNELSQIDQSASILKQTPFTAIPPFSVPPQFKQVFIQNIDVPVFQKSIQNLSNPMKSNIRRYANISRNNDSVGRKYINNFIRQNNNDNQTHERLNKQSAETQQVLCSKQSIKQLKSRQQNSTETQVSFYFTPKAKKELLKKKILVKKHGSLQVGMIVNLQEDIITCELSTIRRYALLIKIFISALVPIQQVSVSIKFPNWLQCISKSNTGKQAMKEQSQFIASFIVQLKSSRERIIKRNYGELPIITVVCVDRSDKKQVISEPLYILSNRFSMEKAFTQEDFSQLISSNYKITMPFLVHERIATDIKSMRQYFPGLNMHNLQAGEKMQLFEMQEMIFEDYIGVVKLQFVKNNQQMILIFLQAKIEHSNTRVATGRSYLLVQLSPLRPERWSYVQLHIFQTCLRSILCADK